MKHGFLIEDNVAHELTFRRLFLRLAPFLRTQTRLASIALVCILIYTAAGRGIPLIFGKALDQGLSQKSVDVVVTLALILLGVQLLRAAFGFLQRIVVSRLGNRILFQLRSQVLRHVQAQPNSFLDKNASGRLVTRVTNDIHSLGELFSKGLAEIFVSFVEMAGIFIALLFVSVEMTLGIALLAPPLIFFSLKVSREIRVLFGAAKRRLAMINAFTAESIGGIKTLHLFSQTNRAREDFTELSAEYKELQLKTMRRFALLWPVTEGFNVGAIAVTLIVGGYWQKELGLTPGNLASFILLSTSFFRPLRIILENYNMLQNSLASSDRVFELLDQPPEDASGQSWPTGASQALKFSQVTFRYPNQSQPALERVSFELAAGQSLALVGRTGGGKSTLVQLLQRFYEPQEGEIRIGDTPLNQISRQSLRQHIGVVLQENFMFRGTIAENISLCSPKISRAQIAWAAEQAAMSSLLAARPLGLDAAVSERGLNLSVGERQLIAFARVLAFNPEILILDEATANIDSHHEALIQRATKEVMRGRTSIIIAHRLSTVSHCDQTVLLESGRIVERGTHTELLLKRGPYWELHQRSRANGQILEVTDSRSLN